MRCFLVISKRYINTIIMFCVVNVFPFISLSVGLDLDERHKPKRAGLTIKLFCTLQVLLEFLPLQTFSVGFAEVLLPHFDQMLQSIGHRSLSADIRSKSFDQESL